MKTAIILTNIGSPEAPTTKATKIYLKKFLSDRRVVKVPKIIWWFVLRLLILPFRSKKSAHAYQKIWTSAGSPLVAISKKQAEKLDVYLKNIYGDNVCAVFATHYGEPDVAKVAADLKQQGYEKFILLPLYPQYSASTTASSFDLFAAEFKNWQTIPNFILIRDYHDHPDYIHAVADKIKQYWQREKKSSYLLFSFHGLPEQFILDGDIYQQQAKKSAQLIAEKLELSEKDWSISFQSRLGPAQWLQPYTDKTLIAFAKNGIETVDVVCPGFSADCLETLEEIALQNRDLFLENGGKMFRYIPALNEDDAHIKLFFELVKPYL